MSDTTTIARAKDLDASRTEALQGLLSALAHHARDDDPGPAVSSEQLERLSEKIGELLGDDTDRGLTPGGQPSKLLNEDGLPIVDISEPVSDNLQASPSVSHVAGQNLVPFSLLPPDERERRRRERDRILDLLEEEERLQRLQEEQDAEEERREAIKRLKESAKNELEQLKSAQALQKKMGQALIRHADKTEMHGQERDSRSAKKSVSFADIPSEKEQQTETKQPEWGDVTPGRLRAQSRIPLVNGALQGQRCPVKTHVVERRPAGSSTPPILEEDSDDESTFSGEHPLPHVNDDSSEETDQSSSSNNYLFDEEQFEEGFDYDAAQHHREIALEYHKKRSSIGTEAAKVIGSESFDDDEQRTVQPKGQLPLSRFRADRMVAAYDKSRTPVGQFDAAASRPKSLRSAVRLGKVENDQLVGGCSGESGSEDEIAREVIEMLRTGKIQNVGADIKLAPMTTPFESARGAKPSRFKLACGGAREAATHQDGAEDGRSLPAVVSSVVERTTAR